MAKVINKGEQIEIILNDFEMIWSLKRTIRLHKSQITNITNVLPKTSIWELRMPGSFFPGIIKAGTYFTRKGREFWYVTFKKKHVVVIGLTNNKYKRIVLGFTTKEETIKVSSLL